MTPVAERLSDERIAEMLAAAEKAGGREWFTDKRPTIEGLAIVDDGASMWPINCEWPQAQFIALSNPVAITAALTELQHRRAAEAGTPDASIDPKLVRYVEMLRHECAYKGPCSDNGDGCSCSAEELNERHMRALAASPSSPATGVRVSKLEWKPYGEFEHHASGLGSLYIIMRRVPASGEHFLLRAVAINQPKLEVDVKSLVEAQAAAQADYEARIMAALQ